MIPIIINVRDRVSELRQLVAWLEQAGEERITLLDNASTWPPLLEYLDASPHQVVRLSKNAGSRSIWSIGMVPNEPFVFTDPDIIPIEQCPPHATQYLQELLDRHPTCPKAGLGLYLEDVPESFYGIDWERELMSPAREIDEGVFNSPIDTTFALYRPDSPFAYAAIRTDFPFQARHSSWYTEEPDEENRYYLEHAIAGPEGSSWAEQRVLRKDRDHA